MDYIKLLEEDQMRHDIPAFRPGDTVRVAVKIREGNRERTQMYEGVVIAIKGTGLSKTITVRRVSYAWLLNDWRPGGFASYCSSRAHCCALNLK